MASKTGTARSARIYIDHANSARTVMVGVYGDVRGGPGSLLAHGSLRAPTRGAWNALRLSSHRIVAHHRYWLAVLGRGGTTAFRDRRAGRCRSQTSRQAHLKAFSVTWRSGAWYRTCPISAYILRTSIPKQVTSKPPSKPAPRPPGTPTPGPTPGPTPSVGPAGLIPATCTTTLSPGANLEQALSHASGGQVLCLTAGSYGASNEIDLSGINPSSNVILQPAPGAVVSLGWLNMTGSNQNLTVQGFSLVGGVSLTDAASNVVFQFNQITGNQGAGSGFYFYGDGKQQTNIQVLYNQMDHLAPPDLSPTGAGQCVTVVGTDTLEHNFTISHNVCGPGIGNHLTQVGGVDGLIEDYNTFLGPAAPEALSTQQHNNVLQLFGDADNVDFSHNVIRDTDSRGQTILIQSGQFSNIKVTNNLIAEDPSCMTNVNCHSYAFSNCAASGFNFSYNTIVDSYWGVLLDNNAGDSACTSEDGNQTVTHNIFATPDGKPNGNDIGFGDQGVSGVTFDFNVTQDASAKQTGSSNFVINWKPSWTDKTSYVPAGLKFAAGYTGG